MVKTVESEISGTMDTKRLETLVDGIFAIAMTLLVLGLAAPQISGPLTNATVTNAILNIIPNLISLIISFILLAVFWKIHHRIFKQIDRMDGTLLWINVIWLLFIVLVPFSSTLTGDYGQFPVTHVVFNLNMLGIAVLLFLNWEYATRHNFILDTVDKAQITFTKRINIAFICLVFLAILLSYYVPSYAEVVYLIIFPLEQVLQRV